MLEAKLMVFQPMVSRMTCSDAGMCCWVEVSRTHDCRRHQQYSTAELNEKPQPLQPASHNQHNKRRQAQQRRGSPGCPAQTR